MENSIKLIKACRTQWLNKIAGLSTAQLNHIPTGFNNNLAWQMGHSVITQQILCYRLSGNKFIIEKNDIKSGIYILRLTSQNNNVNTKKIIFQ